MSLNAVNESLSHVSNLYRPVTVHKLQNNLASFYERTSKNIDAQFRKLLGEASPHMHAESNPSPDAESDIPRLKPQGIGSLIDIYI